MTTLKQWAKQNRTILVVVGIITVLMFMSGKNQIGTQATVPTKCFEGIPLPTTRTACHNVGCVVSDSDGIGPIIISNECVSCIINGKQPDEDGGAATCCSKWTESSDAGINFCSDKPADAFCKEGFIGQLGDFIQKSGIPLQNCNTAGMIGIGIAILFFVIILSFI